MQVQEDLGSLGWEDPLGGGHGHQLRYSCLENSMDRGAWRATVHGAAKRQTQLRMLVRARARAHTPTHTHTHTVTNWDIMQEIEKRNILLLI